MRLIIFLFMLVFANGVWAQQMGPQMSECAIQGANPGGRPSKKNSYDLQITQLDDEIADLEDDVERYDVKQEKILTQLDRFFSAEAYAFIVRTHMEKMNLCSDYKTYPGNNCFSGSKEAETLCGGKDEVPAVLKSKWITSGGGYCNAFSSSDRGSVSTAVCDDNSLKNPTAKSLNSRECVRLLTDYRKNKNQTEKLYSKKEKLESKMADLEMKSEIAESRSLRLDSEGAGRAGPRGGGTGPGDTEAPCDDCMMMGREGQGGPRNRSTLFDNLGQVVAGLGLIWLGNKSQQTYDQQLIDQNIPPYGQQNVGSAYYSPGIAVIAGAFNKQQYPCGQQGARNGPQQIQQGQMQQNYGQQMGQQTYGATSTYQQQLEYAQLQNRINGMSGSPSYNYQSIYSGFTGR